MYKRQLAKPLLISLASMVVVSCGGSGGNSTPEPSYLHVSVEEFYFGTRDVGSEATQTIELANRSGDVYPLKSLRVVGANSDEFKTNFEGGITLRPAEKIAVDVTFSPISSGLKAANLDIQYDIIRKVSDEQNQAEQAYYRARDLEKLEKYDESRESYQTYVDSNPVTVNKKRAEIKLPVLAESDRLGDGRDFELYLKALNLREEGQYNQAYNALEQLNREFSGSYLSDDATYLQGYIRMIDQENYTDGRTLMAAVQKKHPDSNYLDTALYAEAVALEELGDYETAARKFEALLQRHRSEQWAKLHLNIAEDNIISRMWFTRANDGLARIESKT